MDYAEVKSITRKVERKKTKMKSMINHLAGQGIWEGNHKLKEIEREASSAGPVYVQT